MSVDASSCRSCVQPSAPLGVRTSRNRRRFPMISRRSPCLTVVIVGDSSGMSARIFRVAGPTNASPITGLFGGPLWHAASISNTAAARLTFVMEPENTAIFQFISGSPAGRT